MNELLELVIARDAKMVKREEEACQACKGVKVITDCPNSTKGCRAVIRYYPNGQPYPAYSECNENRRLRAEHRMKAMMGASGLGERFWSRTLDSFIATKENADGLAKAKAYAESFRSTRRWLVLRGNNGIGKTHLAVGILMEGIKQGVQPAFATAPDMMARYRSSFQAEDTRAYIDWLTGSELLVIDDLGKERDDEKTAEFMFQILNDRYEGNRPTIITTNLTGGEIGERYGMAILSRMEEVADIMTIKGEDWRTKG